MKFTENVIKEAKTFKIYSTIQSLTMVLLTIINIIHHYNLFKVLYFGKELDVLIAIAGTIVPTISTFYIFNSRDVLMCGYIYKYVNIFKNVLDMDIKYFQYYYPGKITYKVRNICYPINLILGYSALVCIPYWYDKLTAIATGPVLAFMVYWFIRIYNVNSELKYIVSDAFNASLIRKIDRAKVRYYIPAVAIWLYMNSDAFEYNIFKIVFHSRLAIYDFDVYNTLEQIQKKS